MSEVVMYCTRFCPYCVRASQFLERKGIEVQKIRVDEKPGVWEEMEKITGRDTVPQIFIGEYHVGGYDDLIELDLDGGLDPLLEPIINAAKAQG